VHRVLRSAYEAKARLSAGLRIGFALLCMFANELRATFARLVAYGAGLAAFALIAMEIAGVRGGSVRAANREWIEAIRPLPAFSLTIPEFDGGPRYSIWRRASGAGRKDVLSFGEAGGATATLEIFRGDVEEDDITASISELRLSQPIAPRTIDTNGMKKYPTAQPGVKRTRRAPSGARLRYARCTQKQNTSTVTT
jgi:hypothetical protein